MQGECSAPDQLNSNLKLQCPEGYAIGTMGVGGELCMGARGCASSPELEACVLPGQWAPLSARGTGEMKRNEIRPCPPWKRVQGMDVGKAMLGGCVGLPWRTETLTGASGDAEERLLTQGFARAHWARSDIPDRRSQHGKGRQV